MTNSNDLFADDHYCPPTGDKAVDLPQGDEAHPLPTGARDIPEPVPQPAENKPLDKFDPSRLRLNQNFGESLGIKKLLTTVPVRKPGREWFARTHPDPAYRLQTYVLELKEEGEIYLVEPELWPMLAGESTFSPRALYTSVNRQGVVFLWPVRLPGTDGKLDGWSRSALDAAELASRSWVRVSANMTLGGYEMCLPTIELPAPIWPTESMTELLRVAFRDRWIESWDHPVLKRLRGEA